MNEPLGNALCQLLDYLSAALEIYTDPSIDYSVTHTQYQVSNNSTELVVANKTDKPYRLYRTGSGALFGVGKLGFDGHRSLAVGDETITGREAVKLYESGKLLFSYTDSGLHAQKIDLN